MTPGNSIPWRAVALVGYFGTMTFLFAWIIWLAPPDTPRSIALAIALIPMLPALRGMLHGKIYTHQWASFLALPYFAFGVDAIIHRAADKWLGVVLVILTITWFLGCAYYARQYKLLSQTQNTASETE